MSRQAAQQMIQQRALEATMAVASQAEQQLNQAMDRFDNMTSEDMQDMRQKRRQQLEEKKNMMAEWRALGHGRYEEIGDEKQWFEVAKASKHVITHFYRASTAHCQVLDTHLIKLAQKHMEARFIKIDAEKCAYLVGKLNIRVMPTLIMTEDNYTIDRLEGFTELGNTDAFTTNQLAERLAKRGLIDYEPTVAGNEELAAQLAGGKITGNKANKTGKAIYESARARFMSEIDGEDDDFLKTSDDEGDAKMPQPKVESTAKTVGEDEDIKIW